MQVAQAETVGIVYYYGVGIGYVYAVLYNGCREQNVVVVVDEAQHNLLKLLGLHLSVAYSHPCVGHILVDKLLDVVQSADAVVHEEHLSVAAQLEVDGIGYHLVAEGGQLCGHGIAIWRRCAHDAHVACSHERELQRARNRRGRHGQRVDIGLHLAQFLLHRHPELLLLVDYQQAQILPFHLLANELMGANEYVDAPLFQVVEHLPCLLCGACAGKILHPDWQFPESVAESLEVLERQHRRRHEHCHLLGVAGGLESSTDSHLGLAEAHVATHQTVHRPRPLHVGLHVVGGLELVGSVFVEEAGFEFVLHEGVGTEGKALLSATLGIEANQVAGYVLDAFLGTLLHAVPCAGAERAQPWRLAAA